MSEVIADVLVGLGTLIAVLASLAALRARSVYRRLHYLTVVTSVAAPLIGIGAIVVDGLGLTGASVLAVVVLLAVTGPILGAATGRLNAQRDGIISTEKAT
ncbi:MAG TPA: monovalent cation/H(+) antiporter subunit G [Pseudonocardiaceae bacterium]|jgi:multicomponent Na+:H+ antiporter subunit G|nr:monovalent cation/H(+) antiporter subunit G [Pseudonocardiaceae bacterium]